jgi:curved DNA-binding protein CbpA
VADLYRILGVKRAASPTEIKSAYRKLARKHHPDFNPDPASARRFARLTEAYQILSDPQRRKLYDNEGITVDRGKVEQAKRQAQTERRAYYQAQADQAVNEWMAKDRLEASIRGHAVFTTVTLFMTTFFVTTLKPGILEFEHPLWYGIIILVFAASIFHLALTLKRHFDHYTAPRRIFKSEAISAKPFQRGVAVSFMIGGYGISLVLGLLLSGLLEPLLPDMLSGKTLLDGIFSALFYPPIAVLIVDTIYILNLRMERL